MYLQTPHSVSTDSRLETVDLAIEAYGASRAKAKCGKDAGSTGSSATCATEDKAARRFAAASARRNREIGRLQPQQEESYRW